MLRSEGSSRSIANILESLAAVAVEEGQDDRALRLAGAADGMRRWMAVVSSSPLHREQRQRLESLRTAQQEVWLAGKAMAREDAIALGLQE